MFKIIVGSKTVISKSESKITFPHGGFLDTLSTKVPEPKFQRKMNPITKNRQSSSSVRRTDPIQLGRWPNWIEHATCSAIHRAGPVKFGGWPSLIKRATSSAIGHGFYPLLAMVYKCLNIYLLLHRVYLEYLPVQGRFGGKWSFWCLLEPFDVQSCTDASDV